MKKIIIVPIFLILGLLLLNSCKKDDELDFVPLLDRTDQAAVAAAEIEAFLVTHFYNYEEFENPPANFDFKIRFDTIAGDNSGKTPLMEQVASKIVKDRVKEGLTYQLYYLVARLGGGEQPQFPDIATIAYEGRQLNNELFDSSVVPVNFDMTGIINGLQDALVEFKTATSSIINPDGSVSFENYGVGAVFIPSGLGYYASPPASSGISFYSQLIFTFQLYDKRAGDQDRDGVPSIVEDLNQNGLEEDDDTDGDGMPNYFDADDDNDGRPTADEIIVNSDGSITYPDVDNDGIPDYLDADS